VAIRYLLSDGRISKNFDTQDHWRPEPLSPYRAYFVRDSKALYRRLGVTSRTTGQKKGQAAIPTTASIRYPLRKYNRGG
jgi:hypothetical protein